jgi:hypothetical protein
MHRALAFVAALLFFAFAAGCTHVAPYQRGRLAHPTMATTMDETSPAQTHVHAVHEGAVGGGFGAESGCGCN